MASQDPTPSRGKSRPSDARLAFDIPKITYTAPSSTTTMSSVPPNTNPATTANISVRDYIYFLPYPLPANTPIPYSINLPASNPLNLPTTLFEPTSTLVLTSPLHTFVDLRFLKPLSPIETPLPNAGEPTRLDWGFAGPSVSMPISDPQTQGADEEEWKGVSHTTWTHWVDSRVPVGKEAEKDEGDMYPIDGTHTLEVGHGFHPHLRAVKTHEEMWRDEPILSTSPSGTKLCIVLKCHDDESGVRGVVVRLGQYVQGIIGTRERVTTERWEWSEGEWKRTARTGDGMVPCAAVMREEVMSVGGMVGYMGNEWEVEEVWEW
jgi:hypothetical protein